MKKEIKILLSQMTDGERLKVIQICNNEDNKIKMEDIYNKLPNNYKYPNCKYQIMARIYRIVFARIKFKKNS